MIRITTDTVAHAEIQLVEEDEVWNSSSTASKNSNSPDASLGKFNLTCAQICRLLWPGVLCLLVSSCRILGICAVVD